MSELSITMDLEQAPWRDLQDIGVHHGDVERMGRLLQGMESGKSLVAIMVRLEDGNTAVGAVSMDHFLAAAGAFMAREQLEGLRP